MAPPLLTHEATFECGQGHDAFVVDLGYDKATGRWAPRFAGDLTCPECTGDAADRRLFQVSNLRRK